MRSVICLLFSLWSMKGNAQFYSVSLIPDSLIKNANAVKRNEELHVIIKALDKVIVKHKYAITILNEKGDDYAEYSNNYSSLEGLSDISGNLYDAQGKKIKSVKRKEIQDVAGSDGFSLMLDDRVKVHNFHHRQYPYTVEYEDEQQIKGSYFLPAWHPVEDEEFSVEQSKYIVEVPGGYKLRVKELNLIAPGMVSKAQTDVYSWDLKQYKGLVTERFMPSFGTLVPAVYIGADDFSFGGYNGNMSSWLELGKFQAALNKNRDQLPDNIKQQVHTLIDGISDRDEKIRKLYEYLQNNTRYISIQLGIGGWQPFDAKYVAANKYGDCKALSNYMISLLKEAGIKANYVVIYGGRGRRVLREDFPAPIYFNHVVACVPGPKDTTWLECTSQTESTGFLGTFTGDRKAFLIDDDGGHIVRTPVYRAEQNLQLRSIKATVDAEGNLVADVNTHFTGTQQEHAHNLMNRTAEERDKYLNGGALGLATYKVDRSSYKQVKGKLPVVDEYMHVTAPSYATVSGKRLFVTPNLFNKSALRLSTIENRQFPIEFSSAYIDADTVHIDLPTGYILESMPKDQTLNTEFGKYTVSYKVTEGMVEMIRTETVNRASFPASYYPELVKYYEAVYKADHSRVVLVKKE
jgi:hypothetical protein